MRHLTVRRVPEDLAEALERARLRRGTSLNQTIIDLLRQATGAGARGPYDNGLGRFAGTWSESDLEAFTEATRVFEEVDEEAWR